ncbi:hypothetical protein DV453_002598 [Geotrichum candidum]|nr:hypothetical protein DV453_002598 [Geotrichum candidum]
MSAKTVLIEELKPLLPATETPFAVFYWKTKGKRVRPLVFRGGYKTLPEKKSKVDPASTDVLTTHFVALTYTGVIVYAIEIEVYDHLGPDGIQTLFVSKADTTGHYTLGPGNKPATVPRPKLALGDVTSGIIRFILKCYVDPTRPVRICLFARAEKQYLFPLSGDLPSKHVLSGAKLIRWWLKVLSNTVNNGAIVEKVGRARLQIPGNEPHTIRSYLLVNAGGESKTNWQIGDVFWPDDKPELPAVKCIPRFKDDPLTRFLDNIVNDRRADTVDKKRFWMELEIQQEFRLSFEVGVIGIEFSVNPAESFYQQLRKAKDESIPTLKNRSFDSLREFITTLDYSSYEVNQHATETLSRRNSKIEIAGTRADTPVDTPGDVQPTTLLAVKRKRPETVARSLDASMVKKKAVPVQNKPVVDTPLAANTLDTSIIRKKPKTEQGVRSLDASLIRKKPASDTPAETTMLDTSLIRKKSKS